MIPRFKPSFNWQETKAAIAYCPDAVAKFEQAFAETFDAKYALSFPYGRSALYAIFKALNIADSEIIIPAYTCVVVPHAIVMSGNIPRFVDINLFDYNLDLTAVEKKITSKTRAIIPSNLFGYPVNSDQLKSIVGNRDILIIQDCAHCFGARWNGKLVCNEGDVAIFSLNISKYISSVFGGMLTTNDKKIYDTIKAYRDQFFKPPSLIKRSRDYLYLLATYPAFTETLYNITSLFDYMGGNVIFGHLTKYYDDEKISLPENYMEMMTSMEAKVGLVQLKKYLEIEKKKQFIAHYYNDSLQGLPGLILPPMVEGATYSHYILRAKNREKIIMAAKRKHIQLGKIIEYSIPHLDAYKNYADEEFPNSLMCAEEAINLPIYPDLLAHREKQNYIIESLKNYG